MNKQKLYILTIPFIVFLVSFLLTPLNIKNVVAEEKEKSEEKEQNRIIEIQYNIENTYTLATSNYYTNDVSKNEKEILLITENKFEKNNNNKKELVKEDEKILTEEQLFVIEKSSTKITGNSMIFGKVKNISIIDYINKVVEYIEENTQVKVDSYMILALLAQESRLNPEINNNGIAQIAINDSVYCNLNNGGKLEIKINNKKDPINSIDWTIVSYVGNYQRLMEYRATIYDNPTIDPWYILKLHNSGGNLRKVRQDWSNKYPLNKEGDEAFIKVFESFEGEGLEMFKVYLKYSGVNNIKINNNTTYEKYTSSGRLYSDPRYIQNVQKYYVGEGAVK